VTLRRGAQAAGEDPGGEGLLQPAFQQAERQVEITAGVGNRPGLGLQVADRLPAERSPEVPEEDEEYGLRSELIAERPAVEIPPGDLAFESLGRDRVRHHPDFTRLARAGRKLTPR
jgi:hypothetical protein